MPPWKFVVGCKWVYKIKTCSDSIVHRYKARLIAKDFTQAYGVYYEKTFAPVACLSFVYALLVVVASHHWSLFQMNVKNVFLNGNLSREVYIQPPLGIYHPPNKIYRLTWALYGLKQASRAWFATFSTIVSSLKYSINS